MLRPQTWYLVLAAICIVICGIVGAGTTIMLALLLLAGVVAVADIFLYKNRNLQANVCLLSMALLLAWLVMLPVYYDVVAMKWQYVLPLLALLLVFYARKNIVHDEKVVRAYDRIR